MPKLYDFILTNEIELMISIAMFQYAEPISGLKKIIDKTDCETLYLKRKYFFPQKPIVNSWEIEIKVLYL